MGKLHITRLRDAGSDGWHMRFAGEHDDFVALIDDLKWEGARWNPDAMGVGRGAWTVEHSTLLLFKDRFDNLDQCLEREQLRQKLEQQRQALATAEQKRREQGIERDINEVPF
jgi:hypothetical protein